MKLLPLAFLALATPALAQTPASIWPTRDVTVVFALPAEAGGMNMEMAFTAAARKARVGMPEGHSIIDYAGQQMTMVIPQQRVYMVMPLPNDLPVGTALDDHNFTRIGTRTVAGTACTDWQVSPKSDPTEQARVCLTDDGVMLRAQGGDGADMVIEAKEVRYGALDPSLFAVPAGFQRMDLPGMAQPPARR